MAGIVVSLWILSLVIALLVGRVVQLKQCMRWYDEEHKP